MQLSTETFVVIPKPHEEVFDFCTDDENTARTLQPLGPIAGVAKHGRPPAPHRSGDHARRATPLISAALTLDTP